MDKPPQFYKADAGPRAFCASRTRTRGARARARSANAPGSYCFRSTCGPQHSCSTQSGQNYRK